jgi:hypothetical protein
MALNWGYIVIFHCCMFATMAIVGMAAGATGFPCVGVVSVAHAITLVGAACVPSQVFQPVVTGNVVVMAAFRARRAGTDESL